MATLTSNVLTLMDWAKRLDAEGNARISSIVELLAQTNEVLDDIPFMQGNLPTGHRTTVRTGLPAVYWKLLNKGTPSSKSTTAQVDEACAIMEAWSEVDQDLANLSDNVDELRLSEATAFLEAMAQEAASTLFYGSSSTPEEFPGLSTRYSDTTAANGQNIIKAAGAGADNASIWLVCWGPNTVTGIVPKNSAAGIEHENLGLQTVHGDNSDTGIGTSRLRVYQDHYKWHMGLCVKDWRYAVRIPNIDMSAILGDTADSTYSYDLQKLMIQAVHRIPNLSAARPVFYCNPSIRQLLDIQALGKASNQLTVDNFDGKFITRFRGIPIKTCDALTEAEALVS